MTTSRPTVPRSRARVLRWTAATAAALAVLGAGALLALRASVEAVRVRVEHALGADAAVRALHVGLASVELDGLRVGGGVGWPAPDALRAERVTIVPNLRSALTSRLEVESVHLTQGYISLFRTRDEGFRVLPSLVRGGDSEVAAAPPPPGPGGAAPRPADRRFSIDELTIENGSAELFDATISPPPYRVLLEGLAAKLSDIEVPPGDGHVTIDLSGTLDGQARDGALAIAGWIDPATGDLAAKCSLRDADLVALEPYLLRSTDARLRAGTVTLEVDATVTDGRLHAPGRIVLSGLRLEPGHGVRDTVMGLPRAAVLTALAGRNDRIDLDFTLEGDVDDPKFSLQEDLATRTTVALAETLGLSIRGVVEGVGGLSRFGLEKAGEAARGAGAVLERGLDELRR